MTKNSEDGIQEQYSGHNTIAIGMVTNGKREDVWKIYYSNNYVNYKDALLNNDIALFMVCLYENNKMSRYIIYELDDYLKRFEVRYKVSFLPNKGNLIVHYEEFE